MAEQQAKRQKADGALPPNELAQFIECVAAAYAAPQFSARQPGLSSPRSVFRFEPLTAFDYFNN